MKRDSILLAKTLKELGIRNTPENYQLICNVAYVAKKRGLDIISPKLARFRYDFRTKEVRSSVTGLKHYHGQTDFKTQLTYASRLNESTLQTMPFSEEYSKKLESLKEEIGVSGIEKLLDETVSASERI